MKNKILIITTLCLALTMIFVAGKKKNTKTIEINLSKTNTFKVSEVYNNLYAGVTEVTNIQYRAFLQALKKTGQTELYSQCLYDSLKWQFDKNAKTDPSVNMYHWHSAYNLYPIVNISHQAAQAYCNWLTQTYQNLTTKKIKTVKFRLPTEKEWIIACNPFAGQCVSMVWEFSL